MNYFLNTKEDNERKKQIALFRYGIISPLVANIHEFISKEQFFREMALKKHNLFGKDVSIQPGTIKDWYLTYQKNGFDALYPKTRSDLHTSRILTKETVERIKLLKHEFPFITGTLIYNKLIEEGFITFNNVSKSTILRYIRDNDLKNKQNYGVERKAFEMEFANDCWQSDTSHGPYLTINGKKIKTYLIITIDDASRLITGYEFFFKDNALNMQKVLKNAIKKYGVPKRLFVDQGSTYKNEQLSLICANIGCVLIHAKPFSPESKAKVERMFKTIKHSWLNSIDWKKIKSLEELNDLLSVFINKYNNTLHSGINNIPNTRWLQDFALVKKIDNKSIDEYFLHTAYPNIRTDAIAYIKTRQYEVAQKYVGKKICVKYDPHNLDEIRIYEDNLYVESAKLVNKIDNSKIKRKTNIYERMN